MSNINTSPLKAEVSGNICLVTGASGTLGAAIARQLVAYGAHVGVNYHQAQEAVLALCVELAALGVKALPFQADVSQPEAVERLVTETTAQLGPIDILVNNVGPYVD